MSAPTDLEDLGYGRGKLRAAPAASVRRLDVLLGRPLDINRAYASWDQQMAYYVQWTAFSKNPTLWRKQNPGKPDPPLALHPDKSWHCKGMAIDTDDRLAAFREHGWLFEVRGEPWHGQYYTSLDKHYGETAGGGAKPLPIPKPSKETEDMFYAIDPNKAWWLIIPQGAGHPIGVQLGGNVIQDGGGLAVINFPDWPRWDALKAAVDGLG